MQKEVSAKGRIRADKCNTVHDRARLSGAVPSTLYAAL